MSGMKSEKFLSFLLYFFFLTHANLNSVQVVAMKIYGWQSKHHGHTVLSTHVMQVNDQFQFV